MKSGLKEGVGATVSYRGEIKNKASGGIICKEELGRG